MYKKEDSGSFKNYSYYYDLFYKDKDYRGEALLVKMALQRYGQDIERLLSFGCGTGRYERELARENFCIHGVDLSDEMVSIANRITTSDNSRITYEVADIRDYHSGEKYDAVISLFQVMSYQITNQDMESALNCAREHLREGGLFVFDVWYGPGVLTDPPVVRHKQIQDGDCIIDRIASPIMYDKENLVDVCYTVMVNYSDRPGLRFREVHRMRYWFRPEIEYLAKRANFEVIDNFDSKFEESSYDSWTSYFILRAC